MSRRTKISVHVGRIGTSLKKVAVFEGDTVADALSAAKINPKSSESVRLNTESADLDDEVQDNDVVMLTKNVNGGK